MHVKGWRTSAMEHACVVFTRHSKPVRHACFAQAAPELRHCLEMKIALVCTHLHNLQEECAGADAREHERPLHARSPAPEHGPPGARVMISCSQPNTLRDYSCAWDAIDGKDVHAGQSRSCHPGRPGSSYLTSSGLGSHRSETTSDRAREKPGICGQRGDARLSAVPLWGRMPCPRCQQTQQPQPCMMHSTWKRQQHRPLRSGQHPPAGPRPARTAGPARRPATRGG